MSQILRNQFVEQKLRERRSDKEYEKLLDDPITYSIDEVLNILGPRSEKRF